MRFGISFNFCNYTDWDRFLALERGEEVGAPLIPDGQVLREQFALADLAEPLGFDTLWAFEQHAAPFLMTPDPTQYLSYFAGRTSRIDLGSMITVLPWHNPFRLAEQISMLQHFLGPDRKYYLGVGRGLARRNFDAMGVSMDNAREQFNEVLDVLQLAFTQEMFSYQGEFFSYENVSLRPRPLDAATVIDAWGSWTSEASLRNMGERGLHPLTSSNATVESYLEDLVLLDEIRAENGFGPAERPILQMPLYCAESEQEAREGAERFFREWVTSILNMYEIGTSRFANAKGYEQYTTKGSDFGSGTSEDAIRTLTNKFLDVGVVGTPEQCAEKIVYHHESMHPQELVFVSGAGSMNGEQARKSLLLCAQKALPLVSHLRDEDARGGLIRTARRAAATACFQTSVW
jgi:alkanesulfonate monooxygenase SsuD/methylene tetrahydromethanopterin reductase-like flavin-dependent oxidoreductase (luciferase family)